MQTNESVKCETEANVWCGMLIGYAKSIAAFTMYNIQHENLTGKHLSWKCKTITGIHLNQYKLKTEYLRNEEVKVCIKPLELQYSNTGLSI